MQTQVKWCHVDVHIIIFFDYETCVYKTGVPPKLQPGSFITQKVIIIKNNYNIWLVIWPWPCLVVVVCPMMYYYIKAIILM